jgi:DNA polymerase I
VLAVRLIDSTNAAVDHLVAAGAVVGASIALCVAPGVGLGLALGDTDDVGERAAPLGLGTDDPCAVVAAIEAALRPRWVMWSIATAVDLVSAGVRVERCWDIAAVHRLLFGGWRAEPEMVWARVHDLDPAAMPDEPVVDLFHQPDERDATEPVTDDGYLDPRWLNGGWARSPEQLAQWAALATQVMARQDERLGALVDIPQARRTAHAESSIELLCAELAADGLPMRRAVAEQIIAAIVGPRPANDAEAMAQRRARDAAVLDAVPHADDLDLRSPGQVRSLLRRAGIEVPDTRAWRLQTLRGSHPVVDALLLWRKAERVVGADGAAGRMTASAGLHNMPAEMRPAVLAPEGHVFVRADLGQIEPRVLAAVSGDRALAAATLDDDLYAPVASQLGVERSVAKVAVLGAMYGQTTGHGAQALGRLESAYPVAMSFLRAADQAGQGGRPLRTHGGRLIEVGFANSLERAERDVRRDAAARGRYGRNAVVQGAAAELFKMWALVVRSRVTALDAQIVLCLHDELLVLAPIVNADAVAAVVTSSLDDAAALWAPDAAVRFVVDVAVAKA